MWKKIKKPIEKTGYPAGYLVSGNLRISESGFSKPAYPGIRVQNQYPVQPYSLLMNMWKKRTFVFNYKLPYILIFELITYTHNKFTYKQ